MDAPATHPISPPPGTLFETCQALLPTCEQHGMHSRHTGRRYRIQTTCVGPEPEGGYPVFTLLDGDTLFPVAAMAAHAMIILNYSIKHYTKIIKITTKKILSIYYNVVILILNNCFF